MEGRAAGSDYSTKPRRAEEDLLSVAFWMKSRQHTFYLLNGSHIRFHNLGETYIEFKIVRPVLNKIPTSGCLVFLRFHWLKVTWRLHTRFLALLSEWLNLTPSPPPFRSGSLSAGGHGEPASGFIQGSGTLSWAGEDGAEPHQHRAALMKGQAAAGPRVMQTMV